MTQPYDSTRHGDYELVDGGPRTRLIVPETCYNGHPIRSITGWAGCPRCGVPTNVFSCGDLYCDGKRTSRAHEKDCPRQG
jgi:hypothetical protein